MNVWVWGKQSDSGRVKRERERRSERRECKCASDIESQETIDYISIDYNFINVFFFIAALFFPPHRTSRNTLRSISINILFFFLRILSCVSSFVRKCFLFSLLLFNLVAAEEWFWLCDNVPNDDFFSLSSTASPSLSVLICRLSHSHQWSSSVPSVIVLRTVSVLALCYQADSDGFCSHLAILILVELQNITNLYLSGEQY